MTTYKPVATETDGLTIEASRIVTRQQGSWRWQLRLERAWYRAVYSSRVHAWIWKSTAHSGSFSGGPVRKPHTTADGSLHHKRLNGIELAALAAVRGEA